MQDDGWIEWRIIYTKRKSWFKSNEVSTVIIKKNKQKKVEDEIETVNVILK